MVVQLYLAFVQHNMICKCESASAEAEYLLYGLVQPRMAVMPLVIKTSNVATILNNLIMLI